VQSRIEIVAEYRSGPGGTGQTVVRSIRGGHHFAARQTGPGLVHLVGTAAGPLGGDDVTIEVRLGPGARLAVRSAGATIVQPGATVPDSRLRLLLTVADGGSLDFGCEPTVVCHRAEHETEARLELSGSGQVQLMEQVLLGRSYEPAGGWTGRTRMTRDGVPELRHTLRSALIAADGIRVISTLLRSGVEAVPATCGNAVALPLATGGLLVSATGTELLGTQAELLTAAGQAVQSAQSAGSSMPEQAVVAGSPALVRVVQADDREHGDQAAAE
jgi:urease accessory protein